MTLATLPAPTEEDVFLLPGEDQLPSDDDQTMETQRHKMQMDLLIESLDPWLAEREDGYVGGNMFIYFSQAQIKTQDFKGPDFFAVTGVPKRERKSWVVWQEEKAPDVVIELLSPSTAQYDKTEKKAVYQDKMRVSEYYWYDPWNPEDFSGFTLTNGRYQPLEFNNQGWLLSQSLNLALVRWAGAYRDVEAVWLRWVTLEGELLPTAQELAIQATQQAEEERRRALEATQQDETERRRVEILSAKLRELGVDPDTLD
ncbi:MAG: Uma2 family endonuclease [Cyanobacteria bacterium RI_101]|nr:Uma2 family endonuclease [Cyanobacteria bacterium RI_101]